MENKDITITLTSCARFDLLETTTKSLIEFWDGQPPEAFYINEDSGLPIPESIGSHIKSMWPNCDYREFAGLKNQIAAIDRMYKEVKTPYIFHNECDWQFYKTGFIQKSLSILEENPNLLQVLLREPNDRNKHPTTGQIKMTLDRVKFQLMKTGHARVWHGHSWNPGLRRLSDYKKVFPNGFASMVTDPRNGLKSESEIGAVYLRHGYRAATLLDGYCKHLGTGRTVK